MAPIDPAIDETPSNGKHRPPTVAVIGCGPAGMFFLHAIATKRRSMEEAGDSDGLGRLPIVTCYERAASPGGVWRAERSRHENGHDDAFEEKKDDDGKDVRTNMYEALWTNGPKECIEFFDYTYDEHFGMPLPTYMPRQPLLEYFLARVTRYNPNFFDDVKFNTTVASVSYDDATSKFTVVTKDNETGERNSAEYDKCIWAAGENGKPSYPGAIDSLLKDNGFQGKVMHSSQVGDFEKDVRDKRILMVGDSYSAEDLALQAIKVGAEKIYIYSRTGEGIVSYSASWPMDKVEMIEGMMPTDVIEEGRGIRFQEMIYDTEEWEYVLVEEDGKALDLHDISTVIYCTGYSCNMTMLDESLRQPFIEYEDFEDVPDDWKMKANCLTDELGDVPPYEPIEPYYGTVNLGIYRGVLISNNNMMFIQQVSSSPLFEIDANAWLCLAYITGDAELPPPEVMRQRNAQQILDEMDVPNCRYRMDGNYFVAWSDLKHNHWANDELDPRVFGLDEMEESFHLRLIAQNMRDARHPFDIGTFKELNDKGKALLKVVMSDFYHRVGLPTEGPDTAWKTFRDSDPSGAVSLHTGTKAVPLRKRWLDLADDAYDDLLGKSGAVAST